MGMRINQNVLSQSTYANLTQANNRLENSITKLSSGLRINSAADDAAGLAISEKMRRQIKGLSRANLNAQDGISMVQAAEGALSQSQSIIQRMRELALQSANDTLTSNDRLEIQKEVDELKTQIDSIANSTEFNTKKLLNGNQSALISTSSDSIGGIVNGRVSGNGDYDISLKTLSGGISQIQESQILKNKNTGSIVNGTDKLQNIGAFYSDSGEFSLSSQQTLTITGNGKSASITLDSQMSLNDVAASLQNAMTSDSGLGIKNSSVSVTSEGKLQMVSGMVGEQGEFNIAGSQDVLDGLGFATSRASANSMVRVTMSDSYGNTTNVDTSNNQAVGLLEGIDITFDSQAANVAGSGGIIDGLKFGSASSSLVISVGTSTVTANFGASGTYSMEGIANIINDAAKAQSASVSASVVDGQIRLNYTGSDSDSSINVTTGNDTIGILAGNYNGFVTGNKDSDAAIQGISLLASDYAAYTVTMTISANSSASASIKLETISVVGSASFDLKEINEFVTSANSTLQNASVEARVDVINGSLVFTSNQVGNKSAQNSSINFSITDTHNVIDENLGLKSATTYGSGASNAKMHVVDTSAQFQIGADAGDNMKIGIADMGTKALGLDKIDLTSVANSEKSLERINQALDKVSSERSKLGSYQNRLNYTISNLSSTTTNLSAAESRIRDVDVASEMMEFTRNQIVSQAGISMLAQANALPQNALSLLG